MKRFKYGDDCRDKEKTLRSHRGNKRPRVFILKSSSSLPPLGGGNSRQSPPVKHERIYLTDHSRVRLAMRTSFDEETVIQLLEMSPPFKGSTRVIYDPVSNSYVVAPISGKMVHTFMVMKDTSKPYLKKFKITKADIDQAMRIYQERTQYATR